METAKSRVKTNKYGQFILSGEDLREVLLQGKNIDYLTVGQDEEIELFKKYQSKLLEESVVFLDPASEDLSVEDFHKEKTKEWIFPKSYQEIDVKKWLLDKCKTQEQIERVEQEYQMYEERDLIMLLRLFIFLVDYMRKHKFIWGVGRGSSVSSYILYLIGIHKVDSIFYNLDINEYLK